MTRRTHRRNGGFSLLESMAVLTIAGVLMTFAVPGITKNAEVVRMNKAVADLRSLWRAERRFRLEQGSFTDSLLAMENAGYIRDNFRTATSPYAYAVTVGKRSEVTIEATRAGSTNWFGTLRIDEFGDVSGNIMSKDGHLLTP
jgi:prepilin-type N-terminal cleavage/methylation domain-containing protein